MRSRDDSFISYLNIILFSVVGLVCILGCDSSSQEQIGTSYFLRKGDLKTDVVIGFGTKEMSEGIVGPTVFEVHWNDHFILAKRYPSFQTKDVVEYYILEKVVFGEAKASENMIGPLTLEQYEAQKNEFSIVEENMQHILLEDLQ